MKCQPCPHYVKPFYAETQSRIRYTAPFAYDSIKKVIINAQGETVATIHLSHLMKAKESDRSIFGYKVVRLLNSIE